VPPFSIDPPGSALETFDAIEAAIITTRSTSTFPRVEVQNYPGRNDPRPHVEQGGQTPDGKAFRDVDEYKRILLADKDQSGPVTSLRNCSVWRDRAICAPPDREVVEQLVAKSREKGLPLSVPLARCRREDEVLNK
jgi:hypothetical protein